ncbi:MAG TPA: glycoside hydrolase family 16 protein [Trebonia sp.]|nr:glycoside hydrolase family 16 protein [Trebonia sp.]
MSNAGPPWASPSQDPYGYQPRSSQSAWPDDAPAAGDYHTTGTSNFYGAETDSRYGAETDSRYGAETDGFYGTPTDGAYSARTDRAYGAGTDSASGPRTDGSGGGGTHSTRASTSGEGRHGRPARGRLARWATASGIVVVLVGATAAVGFLARSSSAARSSSPTSELGLAPAPTGASSASAPTAKSGSTTTSTAGSVPAGLGSNWKLTFNAGFTGSKLDSSVWGTCYPWQPQSGCANFGNSDLEYQWYAASQDQVSDGALHIVAQSAPTAGRDSGGAPEEYSYRSGLVTTFPGYKFQYGYLQVEARIPDATGTWSALWLAAANEQWPPEIDILEHWGTDSKYYEYYHPANAPRENAVQTLGNLSNSWHTYGVYWSQSKVIWYIDGHQVFETGRNVPQQPMYFLANVAIDVRVQSLDTSMDIKSVSVWQQGG